MRRAAGITALLILPACGRVPSAPIPHAALWLVTSPTLSSDSAVSDAQGGLVRLDTSAIRPVLAVRGGSARSRAVATFTTYQRNRYHPEMLRAITGDTAIIGPFGGAVITASTAAGKGLLVDAQELSPQDIGRFLLFLRGLANAARERDRSPFGVIVPAGDTLAYPTLELARVADVIVVRFGAEHRPGTGPGPLVSADFVRRELGNRSNGLGASRLAAEFPLFGYMWQRDGTARTVTYREANAMLLQEAGSFRRDPASRYLSAILQNGSTIWIPDAETIRSLVAAAQSRGVNTIALSGIAGADPSLIQQP